MQQVCNRLAVPAPLQAIMTRGQQYASVSDIVAAKDEMKIAKVAQQHGSAPTRSSIIAMLIYLNMQLHLASSLTDDNIRAIADDLTNNPEIKWWLTLADVQMLCRNILNGTYAHYYNRFGLDTFYECFNKYCNERNNIHRNQAESHPKPDPYVLEEVDLSYHLEDGRLVVHEKQPEKKRPQRYLYNAKGEIVGNNPAYWASFGIRHEMSSEDIEEMNRSNKFQQRVCQIIDRDHCDYLTAILRATEEERKENGELSVRSKPTTPTNFDDPNAGND